MSKSEIKSYHSTHLNSFQIEHITKIYRINSLISLLTSRFNLNLSETSNLNLSKILMLHSLRVLQHNYRKHLRFDRLYLKYLLQRLTFLKQQQRNWSQRFNDRCEIEVRSSLRYVSKTSSLDLDRRSLLRRLEIKLTFYTQPQSEPSNSVSTLSCFPTLTSHYLALLLVRRSYSKFATAH